MKKRLKFLLTLLTSLSLIGCSNNTVKEDDNQIKIENASFSNTYSSIIFEFKVSPGARNYNAYFSANGRTVGNLVNIVPKTKYDLPSLADGKYSVSLKAFAKPDYIDSFETFIGEMNKYKAEKDVNDIEIVASVTTEYAISVSVNNVNQDDQTPITVAVKKGQEVIKKETGIVGSKTFETDKELSAGNYTISAFFEETTDSKQTHEKTYSEILTIGKRDFVFSNFSVTKQDDKVLLSWNQSNSLAEKKLTISRGTSSSVYSNYFKGIKIESGMLVPMNYFQEGNLILNLELIPLDTESYNKPAALNAELNIFLITLSKPEITVNYDKENRRVILDCLNFSGKYNISVSYAGLLNGATNDDYQNMIPFSFEDTVTSFPRIWNNVTTTWKEGKYNFAVKHVPENGNEKESETVTKEIEIAQLSFAVNAEISEVYSDGQNSVMTDCNFTLKRPSWANSYNNGNFSYLVAVLNEIPNNQSPEVVWSKEYDFNSESVYFPERKIPFKSFASGNFYLEISVSEKTKKQIGTGYGFKYLSKKSNVSLVRAVSGYITNENLIDSITFSHSEYHPGNNGYHSGGPDYHRWKFIITINKRFYYETISDLRIEFRKSSTDLLDLIQTNDINLDEQELSKELTIHSPSFDDEDFPYDYFGGDGSKQATFEQILNNSIISFKVKHYSGPEKTYSGEFNSVKELIENSTGIE